MQAQLVTVSAEIVFHADNFFHIQRIAASAAPVQEVDDGDLEILPKTQTPGGAIRFVSQFRRSVQYFLRACSDT